MKLQTSHTNPIKFRIAIPTPCKTNDKLKAGAKSFIDLFY